MEQEETSGPRTRFFVSHSSLVSSCLTPEQFHACSDSLGTSHSMFSPLKKKRKMQLEQVQAKNLASGRFDAS